MLGSSRSKLKTSSECFLKCPSHFHYYFRNLTPCKIQVSSSLSARTKSVRSTMNHIFTLFRLKYQVGCVGTRCMGHRVRCSWSYSEQPQHEEASSSRRSSLLDSLHLVIGFFQTLVWSIKRRPGLRPVSGKCGFVRLMRFSESKQRGDHSEESHTAQSACSKNRGRLQKRPRMKECFRNQAEDGIIIMWESCLCGWLVLALKIGVAGQISSPRRG